MDIYYVNNTCYEKDYKTLLYQFDKLCQFYANIEMRYNLSLSKILWNVIIVDAPNGLPTDRMESIFMAYYLAAASLDNTNNYNANVHLFVHDCEWRTEELYGKTYFLHPPTAIIHDTEHQYRKKLCYYKLTHEWFKSIAMPNDCLDLHINVVKHQ